MSTYILHEKVRLFSKWSNFSHHQPEHLSEAWWLPIVHCGRSLHPKQSRKSVRSVCCEFWCVYWSRRARKPISLSGGRNLLHVLCGYPFFAWVLFTAGLSEQDLAQIILIKHAQIHHESYWWPVSHHAIYRVADGVEPLIWGSERVRCKWHFSRVYVKYCMLISNRHAVIQLLQSPVLERKDEGQTLI